MEKIDGEEFKPRVLRNGKVLGSVEWKKPQGKKRKANSKLAESESTSAGAPSDDVAAALPKPPKEEPRDDGRQEPVAPLDVGTAREAIGRRGAAKKSALSVEHAGESNVTKRARTLRNKEEAVDPQPEVESLAPKDNAGPLQNTDQQLPAAIVLDGRNSNDMQIRKDPDTLPVGAGCFGSSDPLQVSIKQERDADERDEPACSINQKRSSLRQGRVSKNKVPSFDHTLKPKDTKVQLKRGTKPKNDDLPVSSETATAKQEKTSATPTMANTIEILCPNPGTSQANDGGAVTMETQQQDELIPLTSGGDVEQISIESISYIDEGHKKSDAVGEEVSIGAEKVLVSIPIGSNILATIIKQERNDEGQEPITQQQCSSNSHRSNKQHQERVTNSTASSVDCTLKKNDKKVPLKRGREPKKLDLPVTSETATDDGGAATMETQQQDELIPLTSGGDVEQISIESISYIDEGHKKSDAVGEKVSIRAEKVLVSIPISPNILATIIKQERNDEGQESTTQQQCSSKSHRSNKKDQERVTKSTGSTVDRTQKKNVKKVPLKRGRKPKKLKLPLTSETATDDGDAATMEMHQQPLYVSDSEELLKIPVVAEIPPKDNTVALQASGVGSVFDMTETDHSLHLRKPFQRLMVREWFYSNIDQCLLGRGSGVQDMETLLSSQLPALATRRLNRAAWNHIRGILRRLSLVQPQRRCSEKFFFDERMLLEQRREKVRFLQANPMFEYLGDDLPADLPVSIESGDPVVAMLNEPYGVFRGVVENFDRPIPRSYTVCFEDPAINGQIVPDINVASAMPASELKQEAEAEEIVMIPKNFSKQLELLQNQLDEKEKQLNEMEGLRLRYRSIPAHPGTHQAQALMQAHQQRYQVCIDNLQNMNSSIGLLMRTITRFGLNVDEALIDRQVVQTGQHLQDICNKAGNIPLGNNVLELTLRQLRGPPSRLKELQMYLQGNKFLQ